MRPRGGFGGYLHELRMERGLTSRQLASAAGVHHTYVSKLERGDRQAPDEPVVEALAAALKATPAQLDQLRWRAGLSPKGTGAPGQDDPTVTLVAEALGSPALEDTARDQLRRAIAQTVAGWTDEGGPMTVDRPVHHMPQMPWQPPTGSVPPAPASAPAAAFGPGVGYWPGSAGVPPAWGLGGGVPGYGPVMPQGPQMPSAPQMPPMPAAAPILSPEAPVDPRAALMAGMAGGWQTVDEAAAELRVAGVYLLSLVQAGQLRAWSLPGGQPGTLVGLRVRREDVLALLQPVRL